MKVIYIDNIEFTINLLRELQKQEEDKVKGIILGVLHESGNVQVVWDRRISNIEYLGLLELMKSDCAYDFRGYEYE